MVGRRKVLFPGWMPGLYRKVGKKGATYYTIEVGKYRGLGTDLAQARQALAAEPGQVAGPGTIAQLLDDELARRRRRVAAGKLSPATLAGNELEAVQLKLPFGKMRPQDLTKKHIWDYLHTYRGAKSPVRANREIAFLQSSLQPLVDTEVLEKNPCVGVERNEESPRDRKVGAIEFEAFLKFARENGHITSEAPEAQWAREHLDAGARIANALELSYLTTKAQGEVLKLTRTRARADSEGIEWPGRKGGAPTITEWTPRLRESIARCLAMPAEANGQKVDPMYVVYTREGQPYTSEGFKSLMGKLMRAWAKAGNPRFTFHDAGRAQGITKLREGGRNAAEVSGHMQEKTIAKVYDRRTFRRAKAVE
jgi:hypothetical protein